MVTVWDFFRQSYIVVEKSCTGCFSFSQVLQLIPIKTLLVTNRYCNQVKHVGSYGNDTCCNTVHAKVCQYCLEVKEWVVIHQDIYSSYRVLLVTLLAVISHTTSSTNHTESSISHTTSSVSHTASSLSHTTSSLSHTASSVSLTTNSVSLTTSFISHTYSSASHTESSMSWERSSWFTSQLHRNLRRLLKAFVQKS